MKVGVISILFTSLLIVIYYWKKNLKKVLGFQEKYKSRANVFYKFYIVISLIFSFFSAYFLYQRIGEKIESIEGIGVIVLINIIIGLVRDFRKIIPNLESKYTEIIIFPLFTFFLLLFVITLISYLITKNII